jgi:thymidylate synthase
MEYLPYDQRPVSLEYRRVLGHILQSGTATRTRQGVDALTVMQQTMSFPLAQGFPVITERSIKSFWRKPIGELCAFINGATTLREFEEFGVDWWGPWATPEKTLKKGIEPGGIGPGSYGGAFRSYPTPGGQPFDQFRHVVEQLRELPELRTHFVDPWIAPYQVRGEGKQPKATIAPCHGWVHVRVLDGGLHVHMMQRSGDVPVGVPANMIQYAALALMLEQLTGYRAVAYYHTISDAHVYADQVDAVRAMLATEPRPLPTVTLNEAGRAVTDIHDFRADHFDLADYHPHPPIGSIPVAT